ncbi:MAG: helix-turn-helix domain-containing protein [Dysosmobacter sp.]
MIPFGQILQRLRNEKRWSQSKLAEKLGLSASQVANYEIGRRLPSLQILIDMSADL